MRYGSVEIRTSGAQARYAAWVAYAACAWAFVFAALSFYWAAGGTAGAETIGEAVTKPVLARDPAWIALLWATGALKALGGLLALALVQPWGRVIPRWMRLAAAWGAGALMFLYGGGRAQHTRVRGRDSCSLASAALGAVVDAGWDAVHGGGVAGGPAWRVVPLVVRQRIALSPQADAQSARRPMIGIASWRRLEVPATHGSPALPEEQGRERISWTLI